jgi:hypothetical protein
MNESQLRSGLKVRIREDISETTRVLNSSDEMQRMADNHTIYKIEYTDTYKGDKVVSGQCIIASINGYVWMACDLINMEDQGMPDEEFMTTQGDDVNFDPCEI